MPYKVKDPSVLSELHPATASPRASPPSRTLRATSIRNSITSSSSPRPARTTSPQSNTTFPRPAMLFPTSPCSTRATRTIHLAQFKGKVVLITFIYTRCQLADFCPRMSRNFAEIDKALAADPAAYAKTHLISVSFDPTYDTPKVLRSYGGAYTGNYTKETFAHWDFAAPSEKELPAITQFFNVGITPGDNKSLTHSLSTIILDKNGKVAAWYPTNDWNPADVAREGQAIGSRRSWVNLKKAYLRG